MKILTIIYNLEKGGTQRAAQVFAEGYLELGYDSRVLSLYGLGSRYDEIKDSIHVWDGINEKKLQEIRDWCPDVVHIHSHGSKHEDIMLIVNSLDKKKTKFIETNVFSKKSSWDEILDYSFQLSSWCKWLYMKDGGKEIKTKVVPNPIKTSSFTPQSQKDISDFKATYNIPNDAFIIGRIGQAYYGKWSYTIIDIFNLLAEKFENLYLVIVNPPENIIELANQSKFKNRIVHIPSIYGDDKLSIAYSSFDVFYLAAEQGESFGMVIAESILCGTPVVALATPWGDNSQGEVVCHNVGGYVVNTKFAAIEVIEKLIIKEIIYDDELGIESICKRYDYLTVSKIAINYAMVREIKDLSSHKKDNIFSILNSSYDKPTITTIIFLLLNLKTLTLYSSGYLSWKIFSYKVFNKLTRIIEGNK
jgi:glycosyltransferase involved in cell wall biosynthesis